MITKLIVVKFFVIYTYLESVCCTSETNVMCQLCINRKIKLQRIRKGTKTETKFKELNLLKEIRKH